MPCAYTYTENYSVFKVSDKGKEKYSQGMLTAPRDLFFLFKWVVRDEQTSNDETCESFISSRITNLTISRMTGMLLIWILNLNTTLAPLQRQTERNLCKGFHG